MVPGQFLSRALLVRIQSLLFLRLVSILSLTHYLPITRERRDGFSRALVWSEKHKQPHPGFELGSTSPLPAMIIVTSHQYGQVMCVSIYIYIYIYIYVCVCVCVCVCECVCKEKLKTQIIQNLMNLLWKSMLNVSFVIAMDVWWNNRRKEMCISKRKIHNKIFSVLILENIITFLACGLLFEICWVHTGYNRRW